ncbi:SH3 domain and tetratricopeptide repeat-containing protein 2 isoform X2 [Gadus macrocephalus]|uniref:SH3 domain and tetratricopeptide repeat-containing protein 2 isoform X2 n=1 Tax=Gadus macrocephalus TaxID=80720 RepID=UPI0028CB8226|nr:SH3 domain and tetratricopeptide repeat-containing protein 2 isoform X2 [Gadus macrocephalus]
MRNEEGRRSRQQKRDISPAELDALWREQPYALGGSNDHFPGNYIMTKGLEEGDGEEGPGGDSEEGGFEPTSYWKRKEALLQSSTVSLGVGEKFFSEILLVFSGRRRSTEVPDSSLQEALRTRLRVVESNSQDVIQLFKDLSARLVSVHAEKDSFLLTFKTVEEVWKFSTYLALGYVARCLENFLFDHTFWLDPELLSDLEINVSVDEEHLATLYLGLVVQEGSFFAKALCRSSNQDEEYEVEEELSFERNDLLMVRDTGQEGMWEGTLLSTGLHGLVPVKSMQPLPYPFYQWFLRKYPGMAGCSPADKEHFEYPIVSGTCVAVEDHSPLGRDELQLNKGDVVEIQGLLVRGLDMFIGTQTSTGQTGFVRKAHVRPLDVVPLDGQLVFLTEEERAALAQVNPCSPEPSEPSSLLESLFSSDISSVYRLDRLDDCDFMYIRNRPKQDHKALASARQSVISERSAGTPSFPHHRSTFSLPSPRAPVSPLSRSPRPASYHPAFSSLRPGHAAADAAADADAAAEPLSFAPEDTFRELDELQEDPAFYLEDRGWEGEEAAAAELSDPTLDLLDHPEFQEGFAPLYDLQHSFLEMTFGGRSEGDLLSHLESVREAAKRTGRHWAHRRACFLLGRLCARRNKYSQARVYYEEAMSVGVDGFSDTPLLHALYINLTAVYLKQRMTDKLPHTLEKACAMLLGSPGHAFSSLDEVELLNLLLRRSVVQGDKHLEARVCYLASSLFLRLGKADDALPFIERLQFLMLTLSDVEGRPAIAPLDLNWLLSQLYHRKYVPFLALAALSLDSRQDHSLPDAFHRVELFVRNSGRLNPRWREGTALLPAHIVVYLQQALAVAEQGRDWKTQRDLCLGLASVYQQHGVLEKAVGCAQQAVETGGYINEEEGFQASVQLGWLLVLTGQTDRALDTLEPLLTSLQGSDSPTQRGVIHNLLALCLRRQAGVPEAGRHLHRALAIARESGNERNQALALANLGCLAIDTGASCLAERYLIRSLRLFWDLAESPSEEEHVQTYMWLGRSYKDTGRSRDARACYELGLLIALHAKNLHGQMVVAKVLSRLYADMLLYGQSIIYYEHCVSVSRQLKDKRLEGEYLEILSSLYLSLNTEKSSRKSLDYTKQSLRISIDLGKREEESETWLQVGRIYYLIHEDELADMYLQAAVKTALRMNDPHFAMSIYEEAGDVFFKGHRSRMASLPFFRDGSLPFARSIRDVHSEFRLLSKLTELLMTQGDQEEALQYATLAVQIASKTGVSVNERTAYHRLATVCYRLQQYELAENYYLKSLSLCPSPEVMHPVQARYFTRVYTRLGDLTLYQLKDAFDAVGYFHLALAAALEDQTQPRALYVVYMKLAEIHAHHLPDPQLCHTYRDRAHSLRRVLAGEESPRCGREGGTPGEVSGGTGERGDVARQAVCCCAAENRETECAKEDEVFGDGEPETGDDSVRTLTETEWADCVTGEEEEEEEEERRKRRRRREGLSEGRGVCTAIRLRQSASDSAHTESFATAREHVTDSAPESRSDPNPHSDADTGNISHGASGDIDSIPVDLPALAQTPDGAGTGRDVDDTGRGWDQDVDVCHGVADDDVTGILKGVGGTGGGGVGGSPSNIDQKQSLNNGCSPASNAPAGTRTMESVSEGVEDVNKHMDLEHVYT